MNLQRVAHSLLLFLLLLTLPITGLAVANSMREPPKGPPPEAYTACEGKQAGDAVTVETPSGKTIQAVCQAVGDRLAARPVGNPPPKPDEE